MSDIVEYNAIEDMTLRELQEELNDLEDRIYDIQEEIDNREMPNQVPLGAEDLKPLQDLLKTYLNSVSQEGGMKDHKHWIYESVMETFYGPDIWEWLNKTQTW